MPKILSLKNTKEQKVRAKVKADKKVDKRIHLFLKQNKFM